MEQWLDDEFRWQAGRKRPPRRRAMVGLAVPVMAGTAAGISLPLSPAWFWGAGMLLILPLLVWIRWKGSVGLLMLAAFCLVAAHAGLSLRGRPNLSLARLLPRPVEYVQFVAVALDDAVVRPARSGQAASVVFAARVEGLNRDGSWRRVDDRIRVVIRGDPTGRRLPRYGERWRFRGVVRPLVPRRSGLFTLAENQAIVDPDRAVFLDAGRGNPIKAWCMERRRAASRVLARGIESYPEEVGLLQALLLGYREELPDLLRRDFAATGTVHIFAISGAHVGMVAMLLTGLLQALGVPRTRWFLFVAPLLGMYTLTTGAATSAIRAGLMASLLLAAPFLRRKPDAISTLAVAAGTILLVAPRQLGDLGFLLSFTAVGGLLAVQPVLDAWAFRTFRPDDWMLPPEERTEDKRWRTAGLSLTRFGSVSFSAWLSTTPLTAFFFNLFSPVALIMNLFVIPVAFLILLAGVLSLAGAFLPEIWSETYNHSARVLAQGLSYLIRQAAALPGGHWFVRTPPGWGVVAWYGVLALSAMGGRRVRGMLPAGIALLVLLATGWGWSQSRRSGLTVLDVGDGQSVLVQARRHRTLVDTGPAFHGQRTLRALRREGVNRLNVVALTHSDARHMGAAQLILQEVPVGELWLPSRVWPSPLMRETIKAAEEAEVPIRRVQTGDEGFWPGKMTWQVLWPPEDIQMSQADDASLVLRVARFGVSILLPADAGREEELAMIARGDSLAASVLLAGRQGDAESTSEEWLEAVRPRDVLVSAKGSAIGRHPDDELLDRLEQRGIRVWRTDRHGALQLDLIGSPARWPATGYRLRVSP